MESKKKIIYMVVLVVVLGVTGFLYKDSLLSLVGFGGGSQIVEDLEMPLPQAPQGAESADFTPNAVDSAPSETCAIDECGADSATQTLAPSANKGGQGADSAKNPLEKKSPVKDSTKEAKKPKKSPKQAIDAIKSLLEPCQNKDAKSCANIAEIYGDDLGDYALGVAFAKKACDLKSLDGCYVLGVKYYRGDGVKRDVKQSFSLFKQVCDGGKMQGCNNLGVIYNNDEGGIKRDKKKAQALFKKACDSGYKPSCENLAKIK
ncbi:tetratricopeptide repeat protein [Helicobacter sp. 23-1045]